MTIAISIKVNDGVVLASDSASSIIQRDASGNTFAINIYENANKIFNLHKSLPVGAITWGAGSIGQASTSTLIKDFRKILTEVEGEKIDISNYTVKEIADKFKRFIIDDKYNNEFSSWPQDKRPIIGFMIVGYSAGTDLAEEYIIKVINGNCIGPDIVRNSNMTGLSWNGEPEAITRLYFGFSSKLIDLLKGTNLFTPEQLNDFVTQMKNNLGAQFVIPAMPIQDAIDLAEYLVDTTIGFSKFAPGAPTVGGPIEIAAITKHEGYKWIKRKHYFDKNINK